MKKENLRTISFILCFVILILLVLLIYSITFSKNLLSSSNELTTWIREYEFSEFYPPNINMVYNINIYKENNKFFADIVIDGYQTTKRLRAKVIGNNKQIKLVFENYLINNIYEEYKMGDILLSFEQQEANIYTSWEEIQPIIPNNVLKGIYFIKK